MQVSICGMPANSTATFQFGRRESKMDWESADLELAAAMPHMAVEFLDKSSVFSRPHSSKDFFQHQRSPPSGSFTSAL